jgi:hypothetical protein
MKSVVGKAFFLISIAPCAVVSSFLTKDNDVSVMKKPPFRNQIEFDVRTTAPPKASLEQFAPAAADLFGNMITPASILCGAIIPISFASGLDFNSGPNESKFGKGVFL